jgi:signal peptidase I
LPYAQPYAQPNQPLPSAQPYAQPYVQPNQPAPDTQAYAQTGQALPYAQPSPALPNAQQNVQPAQLGTSHDGGFAVGDGSGGATLTMPPKKKSGSWRILIEFVLALAIALAVTWSLKTFIVEPFEVPTGSMETTIMVGDKLLADKFTINFTPIDKGDIVVFADKVEPGRILVKRVIATGGQIVDLRDGLVYVDGNPLYEPYTNGAESLPLTQHFDNIPIEYPYTVPAGHIWVMGDNREHSADSRYFGSIDAEAVYGRAVMVFWPVDHIGPL